MGTIQIIGTLPLGTAMIALLLVPQAIDASNEARSKSYTVMNMVTTDGFPTEARSMSYTVSNMLSTPPIFTEPASRAYTVTSENPPLPGDCDGDAWITPLDYKCFSECLTGPYGGILPQCSPSDLHRDGDVDLRDFVEFEKFNPGPEI